MNKASEAVSGFPVPLPNAKSQSEIVGFRKKYLSPPLLSSPKNGHRTPIPFSAAVCAADDFWRPIADVNPHLIAWLSYE
jgi:hypothetical protein